MMRNFFATTLLSALLLGTALPAHAQVTDQTDQSEEDWRKSRKKRGSNDIYRNTTPSQIPDGDGSLMGSPTEISPVERLPSESRRHLMRERAKAIAESQDGSIKDAEYVPSEEAKSDPALMADEKEAWEVIVTDLEGSGGQADTPSQGGPNKVAVAGRNGTAPAPGSRGGSTATLQEIMDAIKSGRMGGSRTGSPNGRAGGGPNGRDGGTRPRGPASDAGRPGGFGEGSGDGFGTPSSGMGMPGGGGVGSPGGGAGSGSPSEPGFGIPLPGLPSPSIVVDAGSDGDDPSVRIGAGTVGVDVPLGDGQTGDDGTGDSDTQSGESDAPTTPASRPRQAPDTVPVAPESTPQMPTDTRDRREELSPLERMRRAREARETRGLDEGRASSASDYLGED